MSNQIAANRYAQALFQLAQEKNLLETVSSELELVKNVYESTPEFGRFLNHPKVSDAQKQAFIQKSFGKAISETSLHTFYLLIDRKRTDELVPMIKTFQALAYEAQNMAEGLVYSAKPLSEQEIQQIAELFASKVGKAKLVVKNIVNQDLIGGIKVRIGDRIFDGSVKAQLDRIERELSTGTR
ncbi:F0F1 ATP synthase subunit delta [Alkalihalobacillus oceani]|uniref:F0F1 ATP synthase subunit delta n=1 Tax=Halalkalibacter oceani TaxID=1653776 RepID=UPI002040E336|nr:F0F1 ATP synthase subunit delta [Halalkalibacter oceani]MCM3760089.1 F0F1 ATP synthase subunit delta [Halalkalibacter oceani]